ncbi:MAG: helix-turn-helix domain-containing protein [Acidobacteriota bacterium]
MDRETDRLDESQNSSTPPLARAQHNLNAQLHRLVGELVDRGVTLAQARQEFERQFISASIRSSNGNLCRSARRLGVHRNTLRNKVARLGIEVDALDGKSTPKSSVSRGQGQPRR